MSPTRTRPARLPAIALLLALVGGLLAGVPASTSRWLVADDVTLPAGAEVLERLPVAGALVVRAAVQPAGAVAFDAAVDFKSLPPAADGSGLRLDSAIASTNADHVWPTTRGERTVVALIDTGVAPVAALDGAVAGEINFTDGRGGDGYGHGTFMASLIAGRGATAPGVAPGTGVLSLKVAGPDGTATLGSVLGALQWLHGPGRAGGIRVAALALGVDPGTEAARLLDRAVQRLARAGVLVVVAAGNDGPGNLTSPATAAGAFAVGAVDDQATRDRGDDSLAPFSATGADRDGTPQPDILASGVAVVGTMAPGSQIATAYPEATVESDWFRGSGTSMSAAVTAGVAALAASARPDLDGHQLEAALRAAGGQLDAPTTVAAALAQPETPCRGDDRRQGRCEDRQDRREERAQDRQARHGERGNRRGQDASPEGLQWRGLQWRGLQWRGLQWRGDHWGDRDWEMARWGGLQWRANGWAGRAEGQFQGLQWRGLQWRGVQWRSAQWTAA